jgi:hypothetical protein
MQAQAAGLTVRVEGDRLRIRGPRRAAALAEQLLARKGELLPLLRIATVVDPASAVCWWDAAPWHGAIAEEEFRAAIDFSIEHRGLYAPDLFEREPDLLREWLAQRIERTHA